MEIDTIVMEIDTIVMEIDTIVMEIETEMIEIDTEMIEMDTIETEMETEMIEMETEMIERHLHDFQVARFKVLQVFQVLLCLDARCFSLQFLRTPGLRSCTLLKRLGTLQQRISFERFRDVSYK